MKPIIKEMASKVILPSVISIALCGILISATIVNRHNIIKMETEKLLLEKNMRINEILSGLVYKTRALSAIVVQGNGNVENFTQIAPAIIADNPAILNVILAPNGIISDVYPYYGNESLIGQNYFNEGSRNKAVLKSIEERDIVIDGPFEIIDGVQAITGILPVYINTPSEKQKLWGLVVVALNFNRVIEEMGLEIITAQGFSYELWRINNNTGEKQIMANDKNFFKLKSRSIEKSLQIFNDVWNIDISPSRLWYHYPENLALIMIGVLICGLVLVVMANNYELHQMKIYFERMAKTDLVTGIHNRVYLEETLQHIISILSRSNGMLSVLMIDVDFFKNYNDTYGHAKGDDCLKTIAMVIEQSMPRKEDFVARHGGEEFVVVLPNTDEEGARMISKRLLENIRSRNIPHISSKIESYITISVGATCGKVEYKHNRSKYIMQADRAMYLSKHNGRNRYTYLNLDDDE